jgi:hypothetical protein
MLGKLADEDVKPIKKKMVATKRMTESLNFDHASYKKSSLGAKEADESLDPEY